MSVEWNLAASPGLNSGAPGFKSSFHYQRAAHITGSGRKTCAENNRMAAKQWKNADEAKTSLTGVIIAAELPMLSA